MEQVERDVWQVVGASAVGVSHRRLDLPCQDASGWRSLPGGVILLGVADGAGSASRSDEGARLALDAALYGLADRLEGGLPGDPAAWTALLREVFGEARTAVLEFARTEGEPARSFAATLTVAVAAPGLLVTAQVGDGVVAAVAGEAPVGESPEDEAPEPPAVQETPRTVPPDSRETPGLYAAGSLPVERALPAVGRIPEPLRIANNKENETGPDGSGAESLLDAITAGAQVFPPFALVPAETEAAASLREPGSTYEDRIPAGELFAATALQRGEYANETHFLIEDTALDHLAVRVYRQPVTALAVISDGLLRLALKLPSGEPHLPFFQPLFRFAAAQSGADNAVSQLEGFLSSERVNARTDDDKSLVIAVRAGFAEGETGA